MAKFLFFALYLCISTTFLVVWPVAMHPTLPRGRKWLISGIAFLILVPLGLVLYAYLGVPMMTGTAL